MKVLINEKEYGLQWGLGAIELFCDRMDMGLDALDLLVMPNRDQQKAIVTIIHAALQNYAELQGGELDLTYRQLQAFLDDAPQTTFEGIMEDFRKSKYLGRTMYSYFGIEETPQPGAKPKAKKKSSSVSS